ncbi:phosphopantetheine-binding protein [Sphaerisporangium melleum]|uniref:phosphopantetheine-binding protein n=1 Tax=Sphaerisporangium melleum TaxID=321316 RepID=UPI00166A8AD2|nr:phosphopantetheine-binding protein [Sphaerisporangium melleum]
MGEVRKFLGERLPGYAVPQTITVLDRFPLTANGKIDRAALSAQAVEPEGPPEEDPPPRPGLEERIAEIWAELLEIPPPGRGRSFFALGGDSLLATRFADIVRRRLGAELSMRRFFATPTIAGCAEAIGQEIGDPHSHEVEEGVL